MARVSRDQTDEKRLLGDSCLGESLARRVSHFVLTLVVMKFVKHATLDGRQGAPSGRRAARGLNIY